MTFLSVTTRWKNEQRFATRFLRNWGMADEIIVVDGGSTDNSEAILCSDARVKWYSFTETIPGKVKGSRNPEGKHINECLKRATGEWVAHTEADAWPTIPLQERFIDTLKNTKKDALFTWLYYICPGQREHYPNTMVGPGLTAWRNSIGLRADNKSLFEPALYVPDDIEKDHRTLSIEFGRVHMTYEDEGLVEQKRKFYREVHGIEQPHPDEIWEVKEPLPENCRWHK